MKLAVYEQETTLPGNNIYQVMACEDDVHAEIKSMSGARIIEVSDAEGKLLMQRMSDSVQLQLVLWQKYVQAPLSIYEERVKVLKAATKETPQ